MFTSEQVQLIEYLKSQGYGWAKFAKSIESQGKCSDRQYQTMLSMKSKIKHTQKKIQEWNRKPKRYDTYGHGLGGLGCSDSEAMSSGEYF